MSDHEDSSGYLITFLHKYTQLVERQLFSVRETMVGTVDAVMKSVEGISKATGEQRSHAEKTLEATYLHPDVDTEILIQDFQRVVDNLVDEAALRLKQGGQIDVLTSTEPEVLVRNRVKRLNAKFQGEMGKLDQLDETLKNSVFGVIGALSSEDVIAQKLDHVVMSLKVLQTGLAYILIDYDRRCTQEELQKITNDIKNLTYRQYTMEDEKTCFRAIFGEVGGRG